MPNENEPSERSGAPPAPDEVVVEVEASPGTRFMRRPEGLDLDWFEREPGLRLRHAIFRTDAAKLRGSILVLPGRSEYIEKYFELIGDLGARGFDLHLLDWRGQGLSDGRHATLPLRGWITSFDLYLADLETFFDEVVTPRARTPLHLLGHSMGAHLALRFMHARPDAITRAVLSAPMVDIHTPRLPRPVLRMLVQSALRLGLGHAYLPGHGDRGILGRRFEDNRLTGCPDRFRAMRTLAASLDGVALGGATYHWLKAALDSMAVVARPGFAEAIATPILILSAGQDRVVSNLAQAQFARRLPHARLELLPEARHDVLMETDAIRLHALDLIEAHLTA